MLRLDECKSYLEWERATQVYARAMNTVTVAKQQLASSKKRMYLAHDKIKEERLASVKGPIVDNPSHKSPSDP